MKRRKEQIKLSEKEEELIRASATIAEASLTVIRSFSTTSSSS